MDKHKSQHEKGHQTGSLPPEILKEYQRYPTTTTNKDAPHHNHLNDSGEIDLLTYTDYVANAKMAREYKHMLSKSGKLTPFCR